MLLINVKKSTVGILTFRSRIDFKLSWAENEKSLLTSWPDRTSFIVSRLYPFIFKYAISPDPEMRNT